MAVAYYSSKDSFIFRPLLMLLQIGSTAFMHSPNSPWGGFARFSSGKQRTNNAVSMASMVHVE